jgi:hypothetical protein
MGKLEFYAMGGLGNVAKTAGQTVRTEVWATNTGASSGIWTVSYDFEDDAGRTPVKDPYTVVTIAPGQTVKVVDDTRTIPPGYEGGSYRLVVYWGNGNIPPGGVLPYFQAQNWWLSIGAGAGIFNVSSANVT